VNNNSTNALDFEETYNYILYTQKTPPLKKMKNHFWIFFVVYLTIHSASFVRSEYTWNGSEWVWTDSENEQSPSSPIEEEGSGDYDTYEDEDGDSWDDMEEGSGDSNSVDNFKPTKPNNNNGNNNYNDPYNNNYGMNSNVNNNFGGTNSNVPTNNWSGNTNTGGGSDPYNMNPDNNQPKLEPPYYGNEVQKSAENDINFIEQPVVPPQPAEPTNEVPQQPNNNNNNNNYNDPSIISRPKNSNRSTSFFAQPGTLAAVIGGAVVGLLCAILCVMFVVYRMRKKDEGSYALDEPKRSPTVNAYAKHPSREFYA